MTTPDFIFLFFSLSTGLLRIFFLFTFYVHFLGYFNEELHSTLSPLHLLCLISPQLPINFIECGVCLFLCVLPNLALSLISNRRMHSALAHYIYRISLDLGQSNIQNILTGRNCPQTRCLRSDLNLEEKQKVLGI